MSRGVWSRISAFAALGLLTFAAQGGAQHREYARADIEYGLTVYRSQCAVCHGEDGNAVAGVDLRSGQLRRAVNDRELLALITTGIPEAGMPPADLDTAELTGVLAYLRNMNVEADAMTLGDPARGRIVFEGKGDCMQCHRVRGLGPRVAPELSAIGAMRAPSVLRRAVLDPTGAMRPINRPVQLVTADGTRISGRRLNEDTYTVQIIDEQERLQSFDKADLREMTVAMESPMPSYADQLTDQELADLLAYLVSLKR